VLNEREIFLLNDNPRSLDGRYFGATDRAFVIGRAQFLWGGFDASQ
jgi:type IV secretory pathway protease TraF